MACACNKNRATAPKESAADAKARLARESEMNARAAGAPGPSATGTRSTPVMHGATQSFALERNGRTETFGSRLERDAAAARTGGRIV